MPTATLRDGSKNLRRSCPDKAITREQLSLALVTDQDLFYGYIAFRMAHTLTEKQVTDGQLGKFNSSCTIFIEFTSSLLNRLTGFIYLRKDIYFRPTDPTLSPWNLAPRVGTAYYNAELGKEVAVADPDERWLCFCKEIRSYMEQTRDQQFDPSFKPRDRAPIAKILALDDPMDAIIELLKKLEASEPGHGVLEAIASPQDALLQIDFGLSPSHSPIRGDDWKTPL